MKSTWLCLPKLKLKYLVENYTTNLFRQRKKRTTQKPTCFIHGIFTIGLRIIGLCNYLRWRIFMYIFFIFSTCDRLFISFVGCGFNATINSTKFDSWNKIVYSSVSLCQLLLREQFIVNFISESRSITATWRLWQEKNKSNIKDTLFNRYQIV